MAPKTSLKASLEQIKRWMLKNGAPLLVENLAEGATPAELDATQKRLGFPIPLELRELWSIHDGQKSELNGFVGAEDLYGTAHASSQSVQPWLGFMRDTPDDWSEAGITEAEVRSDQWVAFAGRDSECLVVCGVSGRVFSCQEDSPPMKRLTESLTDWASEYARRVTAGEYSVEEGFGDYFLQERPRGPTGKKRQKKTTAPTIPPTIEFQIALREKDADRCAAVLDQLAAGYAALFGIAVEQLFDARLGPEFVASALRALLSKVTLTPDQWVDVAEGGALLNNNAIIDVAVSRAHGRSAGRVEQLERELACAEKSKRGRLENVLRLLQPSR